MSNYLRLREESFAKYQPIHYILLNLLVVSESFHVF